MSGQPANRLQRVRRARSGEHAPRNGMFLVIVLIVVMIATLAVYSFSELMLAYDEAVHLTSSRAQCDLAVESAGAATRLLLSQPREVRQAAGGIRDNPQLFRGVNVVPSTVAAERVNYAILAPALNEMGELSGIRFGLQDESARLNVNTLVTLENNTSMLMPMLGAAEDSALGDDFSADNLAVSLLMALPNMTPDIAEAILDWLDPDTTPRDFGAEAEFYATLPTPYEPKNGPLDSLEELLLVRGVTPQLLFGADANRNGMIDPAEQQMAFANAGSTNALGWSAYLTVHSYEANVRNDGTPRVNVNQDDLEQLYEELSVALENDDWASFIAAYRVSGQPTSTLATAAASMGSAGEGDEEAAGGGDDIPEPDGVWTAGDLDDVDLSGGGGTTIGQILDLVDATIQIGQGDSQRTLASPFSSEPLLMADYMPVLMDALTTHGNPRMPGRINVNECPVELLRGIPMLDEETVERIVEARADATETENRKFETWLTVEGLVSPDQMRMLMPILTAGGDVYRAQVIGYYEQGNLFSRGEMIIDATTINPDIVFFRDLSHLGRGFDVAVLGIQSLDVGMGSEGNTSPATTP